MGGNNSGNGTDPAPVKRDHTTVFLIVILCITAYLAGFTSKGCQKNGDQPGPPLPAAAKQTAKTALAAFGTALVEICNDTADKQDSGELKGKNAVVKHFDEQLFIRRQEAFKSVAELLEQDHSPKTFRSLAKGFSDALD